MNEFSLSKTALITGGSSGIGLALAKQVFAQGSNVWLLARSGDRLAEAKKELEAFRINPQQEISLYSADVAKEEEVQETLIPAIAEKGVPDFVINSAGVAHPGLFEDLDSDIFRWMMDVDYFGTVHVTRAVIRPMIQRGSGHIINISSIAGFLGVYGYTAYGAAKYAVRGFSDALRAELKPKGIKVSIVFPPDTDTPQLEYESQFKPEVTKALSGNTKAMTADQVASGIIKGIRRNQYIIIPGFENKLIYHLNDLVGNLVYPIMDWLVQDALRHSNGSKR